MRPDTSVDLERSVLCTLFASPESFGEVADLLRPDLFGAAPGHAEVASCLLERLRAGKAADPVLVAAELRRRGKGPEDVVNLILGAERGDVRAHSEALHDLWVRRETRAIAQELLRETPEAGDALLARAAARISTLQTTQRPPSRLLGDLVAERVDQLERQAKGLPAGEAFPTGIVVLDNVIGGLRPGHLVTIAARPGVGKTSVISKVADNQASAGIPVTIFMLEDYGDALANRALSRRANLPTPLLRDGSLLKEQHWHRIAAHAMSHHHLPVRVDDAHGRTIQDIAGAMRRDASAHGTRVFILDNLAEVVLGGARGMETRLDRELGVVARTFRDAAHSVGAAAILVVHLNRELERANREPRLSDLKNSGDIEDASHVVLMLHRPSPDADQIVVDVTKNRNGPRGRVYLSWNASTMAVDG